MDFVRAARTGYARRIQVVMLSMMMVLSIFKGVQLPNNWAEAHWLIGYQFGYVKRGLPGAVLDWLGLVGTPEMALMSIRVASIAIFALFMLVIWFLAIRMLMKTLWSTSHFIMLMLFVSSSFMVLTSHVVGYYDHLFHLLILPPIFWLIYKDRLLLSLAVILLTMFIHELILVVGYPALLLIYFLKGETNRRKWVMLVAMPVLFFGVLAVLQAVTATETLEDSIMGLYGEMGFVQGTGLTVPTTATMGFVDTLRQQAPELFIRITDPQSIGRTMPFVMVTLLFLFHGYGQHLNKWQWLATIGFIMLPQGLHIIAWDTNRLWFYSLWHCFLVLIIFNELFTFEAIAPPILAVPGVLLLIFHTLGSTELFDGIEERLYPSVTVFFLVIVLAGASIRNMRRYMLQGTLGYRKGDATPSSFQTE